MTEPAQKLASATATSPEQCDELITAALNAGDVEAALDLYEADASFIPEPGVIATGKEAIRQIMSEFVALKPSLTLEVLSVTQSSGLALLKSHWQLNGTDPDGNPVQLNGNGVEVVRQQPDGQWLFVIDSPYGAD
jgi:uncharacterized protein (TIGR02246 family)